MTSKHAEIDQQIVSALDVVAEYKALGVDVVGSEPGPTGWIACRSVGREDRDPSAAINVQTGRYKDHGSGVNQSLWDFAAEHGNFTDWREARKWYAHKTGIKLANGRPPRRPDADMQFQDWDRSLVASWCQHKIGVTPEAVQAAGGRLARYRDKYTVIALPVYGPELADADPCGWVLYNITGIGLPVCCGKGGETQWVKMKTTTGSKAGLMGNMAALKSEAIIWKVEGPSDMLALWAAIPAAERGQHAVVCNSAGACENPRSWIVGIFAGRHVNVVHDADQPGQSGARTWAQASSQAPAEVRNVLLPYEVKPNHGKDLRDYFAEGHTFQDLIDLARSAEPVQADNGHPEIIVDMDEESVADQAIAALAKGTTVFQRSGMLVQVVRDAPPPRGLARPKDAPRIGPVLQARLRELLASAATWRKPADEGEPQPCHPPDWVVRAVDARGQWLGIPRLEGICESPVLRADGTVLQTPGYDESTGLLYEPQVTFPEVPETPSRADVEHARDDLLDVVEDFPFASDAHRAAWIGSVLTPLARFAFHGPAPLFLIDANVRGCGKGMLTDLMAMIVSGREIGRMTVSRDDNEVRKRITALAIAGEPLILLDNVSGTLGSPSLDAALTATTWTDRVLGRSELVSGIPLTATWYATANNVILTGDTARRVLHIRLESPMENPEERSDFKHSDLSGWVRDERQRLAVAAVTILRAYCAAGRPDMNLRPWGSFERWSDLVRQAIVWSGLPDPGETRTELTTQADRETLALRQLIAGWEEIDSTGRGMTVRAALKILEDSPGQYETLRAAIDEVVSTRAGKKPGPRSVGMKFHHLRQRVIGGKCLDRKPGKSGAVWHVRTVNADNRGDSRQLPPEENQAVEEFLRS